MAIKDILVHADHSSSSKHRIHAAATLGQAHDAHVTAMVFDVQPALAYMGGPVMVDIDRLAEEQARIAEDLARRVRDELGQGGVRNDCRVVQSIGSDIPDLISRRGRSSDLLVLGQPSDEAENMLNHGDIGHVLMSCGRPVLMVPYIGGPPTLGERVMVAWDGGREAARAVADAMPILKRAKSVTVVVGNPRKLHGSDGEASCADIALHLGRHGMAADVGEEVLDSVEIADLLLSRLYDDGYDLLVMGAYGHSRMRELLLGGMTRTVLRSMTVPVLMSH